MKRNKQLVCDKDKGDCLRACITSILDLPNDDRFPNNHKTLFREWEKFLEPFGLMLECDPKRIWRLGYWIASVPSKNFKGVTHAVVMDFNRVAHDPSTVKRYRKNRCLTNKKVNCGWYLVVSDASKLHLLEEYRKTL